MKQAHSGLLSPFKQCVANVFSDLTKKNGMDDEIKSFAQMLVKARFIVTTNFSDLSFNYLILGVLLCVHNKYEHHNFWWAKSGRVFNEYSKINQI